MGIEQFLIQRVLGPERPNVAPGLKTSQPSAFGIAVDTGIPFERTISSCPSPSRSPTATRVVM